MQKIDTPSRETLLELLGKQRLDAFEAACRLVEDLYEMDTAWSTGEKMEP